MLKINGLFNTGNVKETERGIKYLNMTNMDKDKHGNTNYTYYTLWLNEKASKLFSIDIKRKIAKNGTLIYIDGFLKVSKQNNYTNLTIIPTEITAYKK